MAETPVEAPEAAPEQEPFTPSHILRDQLEQKGAILGCDFSLAAIKSRKRQRRELPDKIEEAERKVKTLKADLKEMRALVCEDIWARGVHDELERSIGIEADIAAADLLLVGPPPPPAPPAPEPVWDVPLHCGHADAAPADVRGRCV